jgi:5-methylcytosine-specific restriction endonuclease McrA
MIPAEPVRWAGRKGARWRRAQSQCMATGEANRTPCAWCGQPIDYELTRRLPYHRMAGTADHIQELWCGGDPYDPANLAPMHRGCNTRKSNMLRRGRPRSVRRRPALQPVVRYSRHW